MLPEVVSHYRIKRRLGAGGMGEVYLADDLTLKRQVAIKLLTSEDLTDEQVRKNLLREAQAAASLDHPNICPVFEVGTDGDLSFIVMQYVEGETLAARLKKGRPSPDEALDIAAQVADALTAAHQQGVVHRDIKPQNIMLTPRGGLKVLDFGLAKRAPAALGGEEMTRSTAAQGGAVVGTAPYMSPEQIQQKPVDGRSDLFALGATFYECLTGRQAFFGKNSLEVCGQVLHVDPLPPSSVNDSLGPAHDELCRQLLTKDRTQRVQTGEEAIRLMELARQSGTVPKGQPTPGGATTLRRPAGGLRKPTVTTDSPQVMLSSGRSWWRGRLSAAWVAVTLLLAAVLAVAWQWGSFSSMTGSEAPVMLVVLPLENVSDDPSREHLGVGFADALISDLLALSGVTVVSRSTGFGYREQRSDPGLITRDLGADLIVDGSVQQVGNQLLVTANLVRPDTSVAWADSYQSPEDEIFDLQRRLAEGVAGALQLTLSPDDLKRLAEPATDSVTAYTDYSGAQLLLDRRDQAGNVERAIGLFESAIEEDSQFALAHAGLGEAYWEQYLANRDASWADKAQAASYEALRHGGDRSEVRLSLAQILQGTGRNDDALEELATRL